MSNCGCGTPNCNCAGSVSSIDTGCAQGCCSNTTAVPSQFINSCAPPILEDHCQKVVVENFYATLKIANEWNIPACGDTAILNVVGLKEVSIGSYLWNVNFGYFKIIGFNAGLEQVTVQNDCPTGNAAVGTTVDSCTNFIVTDGSQASNANNPPSIYPYLAVDFTGPANGDCILITLTNVNGLAVGKNVQIGSGVYRLSSINSTTTATICNDGAGVAPGTSVIARNTAGEYQHPVILIDANTCTNPTVTSGSLIVCNTNVAQPLTGPVIGSIPVLENITTGLVRFQILDLPTRTCTVLTADLTLVAATAVYVLTVNDVTNFPPTTFAQLGSKPEIVTVNSVIDATHLSVTISPTPVAIENIPAGTSLCLLDCCGNINAQFAGQLTPCSDFQNRTFVHQDLSTPITNFTVTNGAPTVITEYAGFTITNPSTCRTMLVFATYIARIFGNAIGSSSAELIMSFILQARVDAGAAVALVNMDENFHAFNDSSTPFDRQRVWNEIYTLLPGAAHSYEGRLEVTKISAGAPTYHIDSMDVLTTAICVAV